MNARSATRTTVSVFGGLVGLAGIEHGVGEVLQGNVAPTGVVIESWPESEFFRTLAGEPAMTVVPNMLASGILSIVVSLAFIVWAIALTHRKLSGKALVLLSIVLLLVGGGFGPPLLGTLVGLVATRVHSSFAWWRAHVNARVRGALTRLWPWLLAISIIAWLLLMPGASLLDHFLGIEGVDALVPVFALIAFGTFLLAVIAGFASDSERHIDAG